MEDAAKTQQELLHLVQATQLVAARSALVHAGAPSLLGQLLPSALQLWSQDRLESASGKSKSEALMRKHSKDIEEAAAKLAADVSLSDLVSGSRSSSTAVTPRLQALDVSDPSPAEQQMVPQAPPANSCQWSSEHAAVSTSRQQAAPTSGTCPSQQCPHEERAQESPLRPVERGNGVHAPERASGRYRLERSDSFSSMPDCDPAHAAGEPASSSMSTADYLTIEDEEDGDAGSPVEPSRSLPQMSAAGQQLLLLLRVLRNLCATGIEATMAMAEEGVPEQVAHLVSDPLQGNTDGTAHLSKVAAQLLANMSANEGQALDAVWNACYPKTFIDLAAFSRDVHGPLCRTLLHCCSASEKYAVALCGPGGSVILRRLLAASVREGGDAEVGEQVMELGWLIGHLVYVRGLLPELFGALAEVQSEDNKVGATLDPLQCVLLEFLSEEMENGSTRQQLKVSAEGAPEKALRSLVFLITTIRELGYAVAKTGEEAPLEASVLEAAFQVLKDLFALDDGGASKASGRNLGSAMCQQGLVPLLLSFLVALGPIRGRAPRPAAPEAGQASSTQERPMDSSITSTAARFPRLPPYLGFRTDIVAVLAHAAYGRREVQDEILRLGGVHIMLGQCQVDDASPMVREWALWGVRNMCTGNEAVQQAILELQPVAPLQNPDLMHLGLQVQMDPATGKFSVVKQADARRCSV